MMILVFLGDKFIPEYPGKFDHTVFNGHPEWKYAGGIVEGGTVRSGRFNFANGKNDFGDIHD